MLFLPWRNEERDLDNADVEMIASEKLQDIITNSRQYYNDRDVDERVLGDYISELNKRSEVEISEDDPDENVANDNEILENDAYADSILTGTTSKKSGGAETFLPPSLIDNMEYFALMRSLNDKQRRIVMHCLHCLKTGKKLPLRIFLTGGAGVGKSLVITAITQSYLRYCNGQPSIPAEATPVIVSAPTGKAAFQVSGMTMHCAFKLPPSQNMDEKSRLDPSTANTLRMKLLHTDLFVFDEISMVSGKMFGVISGNLNQVYDKSGWKSEVEKYSFGDKSILASGHLRQLPPIPGGRKHFVFNVPGSPCLRNPLWEPFEYFELDQIMRQQGDLQFCNALNNMAEGVMTDDDIKLLQTREIAESVFKEGYKQPGDPPDDAHWLFQTNAECQLYNAEIHSRLQSTGALSTAFDLVKGIIDDI